MVVRMEVGEAGDHGFTGFEVLAGGMMNRAEDIHALKIKPMPADFLQFDTCTSADPDQYSFTIEGRHLMIDFIFEHYGILTDISELEVSSQYCKPAGRIKASTPSTGGG